MGRKFNIFPSNRPPVSRARQPLSWKPGDRARPQFQNQIECVQLAVQMKRYDTEMWDGHALPIRERKADLKRCLSRGQRLPISRGEPTCKKL